MSFFLFLGDKHQSFFIFLQPIINFFYHLYINERFTILVIFFCVIYVTQRLQTDEFMCAHRIILVDLMHLVDGIFPILTNSSPEKGALPIL